MSKSKKPKKKLEVKVGKIKKLTKDDLQGSSGGLRAGTEPEAPSTKNPNCSTAGSPHCPSFTSFKMQ